MTIECPKCQFDNPNDTAFCGKCGTNFDIDKGPTKTLETPTEELTRGSVFAGRYEIIEELGKGGMGRVYRVEDTKAKEEIALKLIRPDIASDKNTIERFRNELTTARKITHKNVCRMYDLGEERGRHYITMEYVSGQDLKRIIHQMGQLTVGKAISIANQICDGLAEAHSLGVVHRDLKPNNIMIDRGGNAKIMDFGIARTVKGKSITGSGVMIGTPQYMSPEQVEGKDVDLRSDIYSLGIVLYEMLTDRVPFEGDTPLTVGVKQKTETPKDPKLLNERIPDDLNRMILKCLEKEREKRYQSTDELRSDLEKLEQGLPTTDRVIPKSKTLTSREFTVQLNMKKLLIPALVGLAVVVIGLMFWSPWKQKVPALLISEKPSVAVLPFEDLSLQKDQRSLCDGIPESIIISLNRLENIYVPGPNSSFFFRDNIDLIEIGARLTVNTILTGSVQTDGNRIRIRPRLIKISDGSLIWTEQYDFEREDIFDIQDAITLKIIETLKVKLLGEERIDVIKRYTDNSEAYYLYLKGRNFWNLRTAKGLTTALDYFDQAIRADKNYALAYSGVADCHILLPWYGSLSHKEEYPKAREAAQIAIKLDDSLAEAHTSLAGVKFWHDWDWEGAIEELERAIELNPNYETAHHWYGEILSTIGRHNDAVEELRIAFKLDPLSLSINSNLGVNLFFARRYDEAIEQFEQTLQLNPKYVSSLLRLGEVYFIIGKFNEAIECFGLQSLHRTFAYTATGRKEEALKLLQDIEKQYSEGKVNPLRTVYIAQGYLGVENRDMAFKYLDIAYNDRNPRLLDFFRNPIYHDRLKSDPRYVTLLKNMRLTMLIE